MIFAFIRTGSVLTIRIFHSFDTSGKLTWGKCLSESFGLVCCVVSGYPASKERVSVLSVTQCKAFWETHHRCVLYTFNDKVLANPQRIFMCQTNAVLTNVCCIFDSGNFDLSALSVISLGKNNYSSRKFLVCLNCHRSNWKKKIESLCLDPWNETSRRFAKILLKYFSSAATSNWISNVLMFSFVFSVNIRWLIA